MSDTRCSYHTCIEPDEVGCNRGFLLQDCDFWKKAHAQGDGQVVATDNAKDHDSGSETGDRLLRLPWTGNSLGLRDVELVTACSGATTIGVVGPFNSGKTTLLTLLYLLVQTGDHFAGGEFAGSLSLAGWENLAANLRWQPGNGGPMFPPHTSRAAGRRPGLLHLAFRDKKGSRRDFLFTDPPGEWFSVWAQKETADGAEGARWVQAHADKFVFLVDREALSSKERGKARDALKDLARRLSGGLRGREIAIVWTKSDLEISKTIENDLRDCFAKAFPANDTFNIQMRFGDEDHTKVEGPSGMLLDWAIASPRRTTRQHLFAPPLLDRSDPFLSFRGRG